MLGLAPADLDFELILGDNTFKISKWLFASVSDRLYEDRTSFESGKLVVDGDYPPAIFKIFCDACQNIPFLLTEENCFELRRIAQDFRVSTLERTLSEYIENEANSSAVLLHKWNFNSRLGSDNSDTEIQLSRNLDRALDLPGFASLPIDALDRIVNNPERVLENVHKLVEFALKLKARGVDPRSLFKNSLFTQISIPEFEKLEGQGIVPEQLDGREVLDFVLDLQHEISVHDARVSELSAQFAALRDSLGQASDEGRSVDGSAFEEILRTVREEEARVADQERVLDRVWRQLQAADAPAPAPLPVRFDTRAVNDRIEEEEAAVEVMRAYLEPLNGILAELTRECQGNPILSGSVIVSTSTPEDPEFPFANIIEYSPLKLDLTYYHNVGQDAPDNYFQLSFSNTGRAVRVAGYTLRTNGLQLKAGFPYSWTLTGSNDGVKWTQLHRIEGFRNFERDRQTLVFWLPHLSESFLIIQYRQTDSGPADVRDKRGIIALSAFELFGQCDFNLDF
jgi:hypothetical protein